MEEEEEEEDRFRLAGSQPHTRGYSETRCECAHCGERERKIVNHYSSLSLATGREKFTCVFFSSLVI